MGRALEPARQAHHRYPVALGTFLTTFILHAPQLSSGDNQGLALKGCPEDEMSKIHVKGLEQYLAQSKSSGQEVLCFVIKP